MAEKLVINNVTAGYGRSLALREVSLEVGAGENVAIVGPNGAGKSTLLKLLSGIVRTRSGSASFGGHALHAMSPEAIVRAGIVHVPEGRQVFPGLSVAENLWLGGYVAPHERAQRQADVLDLFPKLRDRMAQAADSLSGGEQQMLAIGRGLMAKPKLLMLDEPTLGLAPVVVDQLIAALSAMSKRFGVSLLIAEQSVQLTQALCSMAHVLVDGRVTQSIQPQTVDREQLIAAYLGQT